jgi:4-aminobutyrate aminotransferase-like enzyme
MDPFVTDKSPQYSKADADQLLARDAKYVLRPWSDGPTAIVEGKGCIVVDAYGTELIDFTSGYFVNNAGHCHPGVIEAATAQLGKIMQVSGKHSTPPLVDLAEKLVQLTPRGIDKVFFTTGGSEANENALKMVRQKTGKSKVAALENGYHGLTLGALEACASEKYRATAAVPKTDNVFFLPTPYCYRCPHADDCATQCLDQAEEMLDAHPNTAAILAEPVQAVGGIIPPEAWWKRLDEMRRERGILLILDEVQTGIGRTGTMFAAEHYGLEPDIITGGKGLSGGVGSLAVVMCSDEVGKDYYGGTTPTSAGNAVSAAAGIGLIDAILAEGLLENCTRMGEYFTQKVLELDDPWVGDVRFKGLLGGVELVVDRASKQVPEKAQIVGVKDSLHEDGMLITVSGLHGNVLRLQPPLCVEASHIDAFVDALARALPKVREGNAA